LTNGHDILRILVGNLSTPRAILPAPRMAFSTRAIEMLGKGREAVRIVGLLRGISSELVAFWRTQHTSRSYLSCRSTIGGAVWAHWVYKGRLQYEPVDLYHFPIPKTSLAYKADASLLLQN
jgi:hypothetical protein